MKSTDVITPTAIKFPVAKDGTRNTIPLNATGSNLASIEEGFPDITMQSIDDGGLPPYGEDFNGLFYLATDYKAYLQDGGYITFDETVSNLIGGYPQGAILDYYDSNTNSYTKVISLIDDNTYNFNTTPAYIDDTYWQDVNFGGANLSLTNLNASGIDYINNSKALETGSVSNNVDVYADILKYAHSTFDISKFTVTGTPTITNDGIASGFGDSNYIDLPIDFDGSSTWQVDINFTTGNDITTQQRVLDRKTLNNNFIIIRVLNSACGISLNVDGTDVINAGTDTFSVNANTNYTIKVGYDGSNYYAKYNTGGVDTTVKIVASSTKWTSPPVHYIGRGNATGQEFLGKIDLTKIVERANGIPVFLGNKTGIDTIKPNDYTVVGTPTISADGVASGFSSSNYITLNLSGVTDNFEIIMPFLWTATSADIENLYVFRDSSNNQLGRLRKENNNGIYITLTDSSNNSIIPISNPVIAPADFVVGKQYYAKLKCVKNVSDYTYTVLLSEDMVNWTQKINVTSSYSVSVNNMIVGYSIASSGAATNAKADLNLFLAYKNADLVYQACLKIPYTLSKTGSKVVDVYNRPKVVSMYEQYGYAPYYTIDEVYQTFTLPMGEVYGMIQNVKNSVTSLIMPDYSNGVSITANTDYTITDNGWVDAICNNEDGHLYINDIELLFCHANEDYYDASCGIFPVSKGDVVKLTSGQLTYFKCKGAV